MGHDAPIIQDLPGLLPKLEQDSVKFLLENNHILRRGIRVVKTTVDSRSIGATFKLQGGLVLVRVEAGGDKNKYVQLGHASAPLEADVKEAVILMESFSTRDRDGVEQEKNATGLLHGVVDENALNFSGVAASYVDKVKSVLKLVHFFKPVP